MKLTRETLMSMRTIPFSKLLCRLSLAAVCLPLAAVAQDVTIGALVSGQVTQVHVAEGQAVKSGAVLLEIDQQAYRARLSYLRAEVALREAQYQDAQIELAQAQDLYDRTVTAKRSFDAAKLQHDIAKASFDKARAELQMAQAKAKYFKITAPFAAKVVKIHAPMGSTVFEENTPLIALQPQ